MFRLATVLGLGILGLALAVSTGSSQDKDKKDKDDPKVKGQLPAGWKELKLSKAQIEKVYGIQTKFKSKISALEDQIKSLKTEERSEMRKVLTDEQRDLLRKLAVGEDEVKDSKKDSKDKEK